MPNRQISGVNFSVEVVRRVGQFSPFLSLHTLGGSDQRFKLCAAISVTSRALAEDEYVASRWAGWRTKARV